jgi:hypothetical protein
MKAQKHLHDIFLSCVVAEIDIYDCGNVTIQQFPFFFVIF